MSWGRWQLTLSTSVCLFARMVTTPLVWDRDPSCSLCYHPTQLCPTSFSVGLPACFPLRVLCRGSGLETPGQGPGACGRAGRL